MYAVGVIKKKTFFYLWGFPHVLEIENCVFSVMFAFTFSMHFKIFNIFKYDQLTHCWTNEFYSQMICFQKSANVYNTQQIRQWRPTQNIHTSVLVCHMLPSFSRWSPVPNNFIILFLKYIHCYLKIIKHNIGQLRFFSTDSKFAILASLRKQSKNI